ncbi:winged helix-turn-helix transcriptional regulator [Streptomyces sp. NPDC005576]|uniref:winged helix-turn-helix transcriptional regulator n=1 Tax=Streptomyces sp. NPDC005576 TaxID=3364726 RepID=UPI0036CCF3F8
MASDRSSPRNRTREEIFRVIRGGGALTRAQLAEATGLSRSTVDHAVSRLIAEDGVPWSGGADLGGEMRLF